MRNIKWLTVKPGFDWPSAHGISFITELDGRQGLVAFLEGFLWEINASADVTIYCIEPNRIITRDMLAEFKQKVEEYVHAGAIPPSGHITEHIYVYWSG